MFAELARSRKARHLTDQKYSFLLEEDHSGELVAMHCESSSYDLSRANLLRLAAVKVRGQRVLMSQHLILDFTVPGAASGGEALERLLRYIGGRPILGYYLDFTVALLDRKVQPVIGIGLPNRQVEVSSMYYDFRLRSLAGGQVDLRLNTIVHNLGLPERGPAGALADAVYAALIYLKLKDAPHE